MSTPSGGGPSGGPERCAGLPVAIGSSVGNYRLEAVLGSGGMGVVYRAVHLKLGKKVAIKVLSDAVAGNPDLQARFFKEAQIVSTLGHPNIINVVDFIESDDPPCTAYVMELITGPTLTSLIAAGPLELAKAFHILLQLADAVGAVHALGIVHRDLKPDNILVTGRLEGDFSAQPSVKILDFGIAKLQQAPDAVQTGTGIILGTPAYMAPEQVAGTTITAATDVYALGEILFEMVSGRRLFGQSYADVLRLKLSDRPPPLVLPPAPPVDAPLRELLTATLDPDPTARPTIASLRTTVVRLLASLGTAAPSPLEAVALHPAPSTQLLPANELRALVSGGEGGTPAPSGAERARDTLVGSSLAAPLPGPRQPAARRLGLLVGVVAVMVGAAFLRSTVDLPALPRAPAHPRATQEESTSIDLTPAVTPSAGDAVPRDTPRPPWTAGATEPRAAPSSAAHASLPDTPRDDSNHAAAARPATAVLTRTASAAPARKVSGRLTPSSPRGPQKPAASGDEPLHKGEIPSW